MSKSSNTALGLRRRSVLVVDDNVGVQRAMAEIVTSMGFEPVLASSRKEAIAICDRRAFDVAFVDKRLVEHDEQNQDGLAILRHVRMKNEGAFLVLLTSYGDFGDSTKLSEDVGNFRTMDKKIPGYEEKVREYLGEVAARAPHVIKNGLSARIFCGQDDPTNWENHAKSFLNPVVGILGLMNLLDELAQTCAPILERPGDNGIERTDTKAVMTGLYWSRGIGEAVVIILAKDEIPDEIPRLDIWPPSLDFGEVLYQVKRKNLVGAIVKSTGANYSEFTVLRS